MQFEDGLDGSSWIKRLKVEPSGLSMKEKLAGVWGLSGAMRGSAVSSPGVRVSIWDL